MPQSERSSIIIQFLRWLQGRCKAKNYPNIQECVKHIEIEITSMGATRKRAISYVKSCESAGLIHRYGLKFKISKDGENWLQKKIL